MDRKRIFFVLLMCVVLSVAARAQTSHWQYDMYAYQYDMTVYFTLDGVAVLNNYEVAAFVNDECRGVGKVVTSETDGGQTVTFPPRSTARRFSLYCLRICSSGRV